MKKFNQQALSLLQRSCQDPKFKEKFEINEERSANFRREFITQALSEREDREIQNLLYQTWVPDRSTEEEIKRDYLALTQITQQIFAIDRQGILLHGERVHQAREILKRYRDGAFTSWLLITYGNRQTPYRMLHFYELFQKLSQEDQRLLEKIPKRLAYILAMRSGDFSKKLEILRDHHMHSSQELSSVIESYFPARASDKRSKSHDMLLVAEITERVTRLQRRGERLSLETKGEIAQLIKQMQSILKD